VPALDPAVESLHLAGTADAIVPFEDSAEAWDASPPPKRFVGLTDAAHLAFSDLCATSNAEGQSILEIANEYSLPGAGAAGLLFDCDEAYLDDETAWAIINYATAAALEEVLHCRDGGQRFAALIDRFPDVSELREER
jgi:fermentation-respiration switch protein FrsA (DUF1100 family)